MENLSTVYFETETSHMTSWKRWLLKSIGKISHSFKKNSKNNCSLRFKDRYDYSNLKKNGNSIRQITTVESEFEKTAVPGSKCTFLAEWNVACEG